jgi:Complex I intermediate-associated protein 30 (CIA30)
VISYDAGRDGLGSWALVSDRVMSGVSDGALVLQVVAGRSALRLTGDVSLENDGGFLQMARDVEPASGYEGIELHVFGNDEAYNLHLRTDALEKPWQSFRATFRADRDWSCIRLPFEDLAPHRTRAAFDPWRLRRVGLVAIGRAFRADLALSRMSFY